jgi:uncharacterized protein
MRERRFYAFKDYLRARFGDRVQRVSLNGTLVCPHPEGAEKCPWCSRAPEEAGDPGKSGDPPRGGARTFPVHEQIRRGVNFARRRGEQTPRLLVGLGSTGGGCPPLDHLEATLDAVAAQPEVVAITLAAQTTCVTDEVLALLGRHATPERDAWLEIEGTPGEWPAARNAQVRLGIQVDLGTDVADAVAEGAALVRRLKPDAVGILAPVIVDGSTEAQALERGEIREPELGEFAARAARFLAAIPAEVVVHLVVLNRPADSVLGPRWVLNRQKVEEAVAVALEQQDTRQGAGPD